MADEDQFERLPDHLLLLVLSSLPDAHSLALSSLVSRRFRSLSSQVTSLLLRLPPPPPAAAPKPSLLHRLHRLLLSAFHLLHPPDPKPSLPPASPSAALRPFPHLRHLRLLHPAPELPPDHAALIRWRADFGSSLRRCAILAASSLSDSPAAPAPEDSHLCANGGLKSRVVWTISSLLAASARHRLLRPIAEGHPALRAAEVADAEGQGVLRMDAGQLEELRAAAAAADGDAARAAVPALSMRLWYSGRVEAGGGVALEGATLVAIRPAAGNDAEEVDEDWVAEAFGHEYGGAARALMKGKAYCLEMNSF